MRPSKRPLFHGWVIVAVTTAAMFMVVGSHIYSFGYFFKPMSEELGWGRGLASGVISLRALLAAALAVPLGFLLDKHGPRLIITCGVLVAGLAAAAMSAVQNLWHFYLVYGVLGAVAMSCVDLNVTSATVSKWFVRQRGRAMAFMVTGVPLSGVLLAPLTLLLVTVLGWRLAWVGVGLVVLAVAPLTALWLRRQPEDMGLLPDGAATLVASATAAPGRTSDPEESWTVREALKTPTLWLLLAGLNLGGMAHGALFVHQIPYMSDKGFTTGQATLVVTIISFGAVSNKLFWGVLAERFPFRYLAALCMAASAGGLLVLIAADSFSVLLLYAVIDGATRTLGLWMSLSYAVYYGRRFQGALRGVTAPAHALTAAFSPLFAGVMYDVTGSYVLAFQVLTGCILVAALLVSLAKPPVHPRHKAGAEATAGRQA